MWEKTFANGKIKGEKNLYIFFNVIKLSSIQLIQTNLVSFQFSSFFLTTINALFIAIYGISRLVFYVNNALYTSTVFFLLLLSNFLISVLFLP